MGALPHHPAAEVFRAYLAEIPRVVAGSPVFTAFAHLDYPVRSWPQEVAVFDPLDSEEELRALAQDVRRMTAR